MFQNPLAQGVPLLGHSFWASLFSHMHIFKNIIEISVNIVSTKEASDLLHK